MKVTACPSCGSTQMRAGTLGSGVTFGVTSWKYVCDACQFQGQPLEFASQKEYEQFLQGLRSEKSIDDAVVGDELADENSCFQEIVAEALKDTSPLKDRHPFEGKRWWPECVCALVGSLFITYFLFYPNVVLYMDAATLVVYSLLLFVFWVIMLLVFFVVVEYLMILVKRTIQR